MTRQPQIVGNCAHCSVEFKFKVSAPQKFCSNSCRLAGNPARIKFESTPKTCSLCSTSLTWEQRGNKYCGSACAAKANNSIRTPESRAKQKQTITKTVRKKFQDYEYTTKSKRKQKPGVKKAPKLKEGIDYCEVLYSPITGAVYNKNLKPATGWGDPRKSKSADVLSSMFSFELGKPTTENEILNAITNIQTMISDGLSPSDIKKKFNVQYSDFGMFLKSSLGITLKTNKESKVNFRKRSGTARVGRPAYRAACQFKFNPYLIESIPGYDLLKSLGMYSTTNKGGVSRDHMISVEYGWRNGIDPAILAHPANCEFLLALDNSIKSSSCSISLDQLLDRIKTGNFMEKKNEFTSLPISEEHRRKISETVSNQRKITNGIINKTIHKDDPVPEGYRRGFVRKKK